MIRIPYESVADLDLGMYIILPKRPQDLNKLVSDLSVEKWNSLIGKVHSQSVYGNLGLPRFNADYERELADDLIALGMQMAFTPRADFSALSKIALPLWISKVLHKAFITVDEKGTEAGAATIVMMAGGKFSVPERVFKMIVDHPFIYAIRDHTTGTLLFLGITMRPS
jgi:serpin B